MMFKLSGILLFLAAGFGSVFYPVDIADIFRAARDLPEMKDPRIEIKKEARTLELFDGEKLISSYKIALGFEPTGDKEIEGDGKTPEGEFFVYVKNSKSNFYLSLGVSYPAIDDANRGLENGLISVKEYDEIIKAVNERRMPPQNTKLGGEIFIHGNGNSGDWTAGCIALPDKEMKQLFDAVPLKTPILIKP